MRLNRYFRFTSATPARQPGAPPKLTPASSVEPIEMREPQVDVGTDEEALAWAEEHDKETADLLRAEAKP